MADPTIWLVLVVITALAFDFINGFHDAANAIATSVATGVMSIRTAVIVSGIFNFAGALAGTAVASFIASGLVSDPSLVTPQVVLATLLGASAWNLLTWWYGIPSSSSHALIGGLAGAVVAHAGWNAFVWSKLVDKVLIPLVESPLIGLLVAFFVMVAAMWICRRMRPAKVNRGAKIMQFISACSLSFAHGMNDAQKVMGIIALALATYMAGKAVGEIKPLLEPQREPSFDYALRSAGSRITFQAAPQSKDETVAHFEESLALYRTQLQSKKLPELSPERTDRQAYNLQIAASNMTPFIKEHHDVILPAANLKREKKTDANGQPTVTIKEEKTIPFWAILACASAMCLGTIAGGKKIIKTMGSKIIRMSPLQGFAAQVSGTAVIIGFSLAGTPLSTTHCISASIMGAGTSKGLGQVRWTVALNMVAAWVITIPASAAVAFIIEQILQIFTH